MTKKITLEIALVILSTLVILYNCFSNTSFNRTIIESALIKYHSEKLYNIHPGPYAMDPFIVHKIINFHNLQN